MAVNVPTTEQIAAQNVSNFEVSLGQTVPLNDKAFYRVLSAIEAGLSTAQYKHAIDRIAQVLALTATDEDLDRIGSNYGVDRKPAVANISTINQPATNGTSIPVSLDYVSDASGLRYINNATVVAGVSGADLEVTCELEGAAGNLTAGDTLTIGRQIAGITSTTATFVSTVTTGVDRESNESYRRRVLQEIRTVGGGGNAVDYRTWAEEVTSVFRAFPFSGAPVAGTHKLKDPDMEETTAAYWNSGNSATLSKTTTFPHSGQRSLEVTRNGVNIPYAYQDCLTLGREYTITGYARSDGAGDGGGPPTPLLYNGSTLIWTGTTSALWQPFSVPITATDIQLRLASDATVGAPDVYFDDIAVLVTDSLPGDRVVYVEVFQSIEFDGLPDDAVLDAVRTSLNTDPDTGKARMVLGTTDEKLFVEPIIRSEFWVTITGLVVDPAQETALKSSLDTAADEYLRSVSPYVEGVDSAIDRNDVITGIKLSEVIQDTLNAFNASAESIVFNKDGEPTTTRYTMDENETAKLANSIIYA
jgi:uncharacterized phage protein gp47/JayE